MCTFSSLIKAFITRLQEREAGKGRKAEGNRPASRGQRPSRAKYVNRILTSKTGGWEEKNFPEWQENTWKWRISGVKWDKVADLPTGAREAAPTT
ncbi:hypothetical protein CEB3_c32990 [Peptococcaceae bacterium CEB3]|nr:hypothetical protein CEB3_c32990 [Peptococcaceae bacterium CEB3]